MFVGRIPMASYKQYAKEKDLKGEKRKKVLTYTEEQRAILVYIELLFGKWCPYDDLIGYGSVDIYGIKYSGFTFSVSHTPLLERKNLQPSANIFWQSILMTYGLPCLAPTLMAVSSSGER